MKKFIKLAQTNVLPEQYITNFINSYIKRNMNTALALFFIKHPVEISNIINEFLNNYKKQNNQSNQALPNFDLVSIASDIIKNRFYNSVTRDIIKFSQQYQAGYSQSNLINVALFNESMQTLKEIVNMVSVNYFKKNNSSGTQKKEFEVNINKINLTPTNTQQQSGINGIHGSIMYGLINNQQVIGALALDGIKLDITQIQGQNQRVKNQYNFTIQNAYVGYMNNVNIGNDIYSILSNLSKLISVNNYSISI